MNDKQAIEEQSYEVRERLLQISRVTKVVEGGRILGFRAIVVVGIPEQGKVGMGTAKSREVPIAIQKAMESAKKNMITVRLKGTTLHHTIIGRHGASRVFMKPASEGTGIIAGGAMRAIFEVLGVENVLAKCIGSSNPLNVAMATLKALKQMDDPVSVAKRRGLSVKRVLGGGYDEESSE